MKLNLGCGEFPLKDFVNIDAYEGLGVDLVCNAMKLPYEDNSIEEIYLGHVMEHNKLSEARKILKECIRVLKPLGKIGIVIPDKDLAPEYFIKGESFPDKPYKAHHSYWNLEMLKKEVKKVGFEDIETMNIDIYPHLVARPHWQTGVVAIKGGKKMEEKKGQEEQEEIVIPEFDLRTHSWCKYEKKVVYNPTLKRHCPLCRRLL